MSVVTVEELKFRVLRRLRAQPFWRWRALLPSLTASGVISADQARDAVNSLKAEGKIELFLGRNGGVNIVLAEYANDIDRASVVESVE